jgi:hypothetical protein
LKENQANLGIVKATVMEMAVGKNVRPAVLTVGRVMVYAMIRVLTLLVTMMMVIAQPYPQLIYQQHLLQHQIQQSNQPQIQQSNQPQIQQSNQPQIQQSNQHQIQQSIQRLPPHIPVPPHPHIMKMLTIILLPYTGYFPILLAPLICLLLFSQLYIPFSNMMLWKIVIDNIHGILEHCSWTSKH